MRRLVWLAFSRLCAWTAVSLLITQNVAHLTATAQVTTQNAAKTKAPRFDVVSIRPYAEFDPAWSRYGEIMPAPDGYRSERQSIWATIMVAYYPQSWPYWPAQVTGAPPWLITNQYRIQAKVSPDDLAMWQKQGADNKILRAMLQTMLEDRCKLILHSITAVKPVYGLVVGKRGEKLKESKPGIPLPPGAEQLPDGGGVVSSMNEMRFFGASMDDLASFLTGGTTYPVQDMTGLLGKYDFVVKNTSQFPAAQDGLSSQDQSSGPWDVTDLGLALRLTKTPVMILVIDHIEEPSPN